jgi:hypothetical protein
MNAMLEEEIPITERVEPVQPKTPPPPAPEKIEIVEDEKEVEETVEIGGKLIKGVFPKFNSKASLKMPKALWKKSRDDHFKYCTEFLKKEIKKNPDLAKKFTKKQLKDINQLKKQIDGLSWHHHQKEGVMQLVDKVIHAKTAHTGGFSLWGP